MAIAPDKNLIASGNRKVDTAYRTAEWLLSAFASTLVFIVFVMQVYRIPTGSMAETLRGAHFRLRCEQCGYAYDYDFVHQYYGVKNTVTPSQPLPIIPRSPRCPCCGYATQNPIKGSDNQFYIRENDDIKPAPKYTVFKGDQIFVQKCIYQFFKPKRWDVIVFKNPTNPRENYIKRCIGLPGETVEIYDGDVYVNGRIQRKPKHVQEELWMVIYDNDYQPVNPAVNQFNGHTWKQPFEKVGSSQWNLSADGPTVFALEGDPQTVHRIQYNDKQGNNFQATYSYDDPILFSRMPICSDLMVNYYLTIQADSAAGVQIRKYGITYEGWVQADGTMRICQLAPDGQTAVLAEGQCDAKDLEQMARFRFATLDHQLVLELGSSRLSHDLGRDMDDAGTDCQINPQVQILGRGTLELSHIGLYRDIHYLSTKYQAVQTEQGRRLVASPARGTRQVPMVLKEDQYFACGDNSPASLDSRLWETEGIGNNGTRYPLGVVPKDYLVGKAMVVHWPGGYRLKNEPIRWIPFADGFKVIYGGNNSVDDQTTQ